MAASGSALLWLPAWSLWRREVVRFLRQRSRIVGAFGTPIIFWLVVGSGLRDSVRLGDDSSATGANYLEYSFPGTLVLIVLFTAIFSTISIIEDRRTGFLQAVVAAPVRRISIVLGKVLGSTSLALLQGVLFLVFAPLAGVSLTIASVLAVIAVLIVVGLGLSALGVLIAWPMDSTQGFHAVMNLVLIPMWALSGAFFPSAGASPWVQWVMRVNPVTYGVAAVRHALYCSGGHPAVGGPTLGVSLGVSVGFAVLMIALAARVVETKG